MRYARMRDLRVYKSPLEDEKKNVKKFENFLNTATNQLFDHIKEIELV